MLLLAFKLSPQINILFLLSLLDFENKLLKFTDEINHMFIMINLFQKQYTLTVKFQLISFLKIFLRLISLQETYSVRNGSDFKHNFVHIFGSFQELYFPDQKLLLFPFLGRTTFIVKPIFICTLNTRVPERKVVIYIFLAIKIHFNRS